MADIRNVISERLKASHDTIDYTISDLNANQLHATQDGSTIGTPASIYFHSAWVQDLVVNQMLKGTESVYDSQGWREKLPEAQPHRGPSTLEWARGIRVDDVDAIKAYAAAVRKETLGYIEGLSDDELDRPVPFFDGPTPQVNVLSYLIWDVANHTGEIAAMRGLAGMKGLPF